MIGLVDTLGGYIALHAIKSARSRTNAHNVEIYDVVMLDDTRHEVFGGHWDSLQRRAVQLIPADPGINYLHAWADGDDPAGWGFDRTPVVAWALCLDGEIRPVTPSGVFDGCGENDEIGNFVEMPGGKVISVSSWADRSHFENAVMYFDYYLERYGKKRPGASA